MNNGSPGIRVKCPVCGDVRYVTFEDLGDYCYYKGSYYHEECLRKKAKRAKQKKTTSDIEEALEKISFLKKESKDRLTVLLEKDVLYCFLLQYYSLESIKSYTWMKIADLTEGRLPYVASAIPQRHLYDMWRRKANYLNKLADQNRTKGKEMTNEQRINYDLSVLINQYDSYLQFLKKEKIKQSEAVDIKRPSISVGSYKKPVEINEDSEEVNIDSILDEVFNDG